MTTKIIFVLFISMFQIIASHAQETIKKEDVKHNQPKYNQGHFREISQNYWEKESGNTNDMIRLDSLNIDDIQINIPQFDLIHPKDGDYTILLNLINVIFDEDSQTAFFDLKDQKNAFIFSISNRNNTSEGNGRNVRIIGYSQNISQKFNYKLFKDYLENNPDVLVFTINSLNINNKNNIELWGIKNSKLILLSFGKNAIEELDGEKFYKENYITKGIDKIQAICK